MFYKNFNQNIWYNCPMFETRDYEHEALPIAGDVPMLSPASPEVTEGLYRYLSDMHESHYQAGVRTSTGVVAARRRADRGEARQGWIRGEKVSGIGRLALRRLLYR